MTLGIACSLNDKHCTYITPLKITKKKTDKIMKNLKRHPELVNLEN